MTIPQGGTSPIGRVGLLTPSITATYDKPADATQYALGDIIGNSLTAASVTPITFANAVRFANGSGRLNSCRCVVTAASGTIVLPAFDLLVFVPAGGVIPAAAGAYPADNAVFNVSSAAMAQLVGVFSFAADAWRNQAGGATAAGAAIWQAPKLAGNRVSAPFSLDGVSNLDGSACTSLVGVMQAQNTWNPGAVAQNFAFTLGVEQD